MALEVTVRSEASGGLELIEHIPSIRPCRLEGRNGVGKSALIRLLLLLSGEQPYRADPASWRSLRSLIGPTEVTIDGLEGEHSVATVRLTPDEWPRDRVPLEIGEWLGDLTLDGETVPIENLFTVFHVVHLSGTERLADTLTQQTERVALSLAEIETRLDALTDERVAVGKLTDDLRFLSPETANLEGSQLETAIERRRQIVKQLEENRPKAEDLARAYALAVMVESGGAAEHERKVQDLRKELEDARVRSERAENARDAAVAALDKGSTAQQQVAKRERRLGTIQKSMDKLLARQEELGARLDALGIKAGTDFLAQDESAELNQALDKARSRYRRLQVQAARNHRTSAQNQLIDDVGVVLSDGISEGLGDTVLARVQERDITVEELHEGLGFLPEVEDSDLNELSEAANDLAELTELDALFLQRTQLHQEHEKIRLELQKLEPEAAGHDELRDRATEAREAADQANAEVRRYNVEIGALSRSVLGGAGAVADVEAHVHELVDKHGVESGELPTVLSETQAAVNELERQDDTLREEIERLSVNATRRRVLRETLRRQSEQDQKLDWVGRLVRRLASRSEGTDVEWQDEIWQNLYEHVLASKEAYDRLYSQISGLHALAADANIQASHNSPLGGALKAIVEEEAQEELSAGPIVEALFDGGEVKRVSLDEGASTITWSTPTGETRTRPLTAFSSGEQALGFMRARLQQIADSPAQNRMVFLDEFGAFVSADRRRPLAELLTGKELQSLTEQVVVVLPLQADYENELSETTGKLHDLNAQRALAIQRTGYFTEEFGA